MSNATPRPQRSARQRWMSVLARARRDELVAIIERSGGLPAYSVLKPAETGTVMVEGRAGGSGRRFNLGEATMTRCVIRLDEDPDALGFAYALGSDREKAVLAAVLDARMQMAGNGAGGLADEIRALEHQQQAARDLASRKAARTKVDFFTLVRGHG